MSIPQKTFEAFARQIEREVKFDLGLASTTEATWRRANENDLLPGLQVLVEEVPEAADWFRERAEELYLAPGAAGYAHPNDLTLCAYLFLLAADPNPASRDFIESVSRGASRDFFAAKHLAEFILAGEHVQRSDGRALGVF